MKQAVVIIIVILMAVAIFSIASQDTMRYAIDRTADYAERPMSSHEMLMESRTTASVSADNGNSSAMGWGIAIALLLVLALGGTIAYMIYGANYHKQRRLSKKANRRPRPQQPPMIATPYSAQPMQQIPRTSVLRELPSDEGAWGHYE